MKKLSIILIAIAFMSTALITSCKKYEEGPAFSLLSKKTRLSGEWTLESYTVNGVDYTKDFLTFMGANYMFELEKDGKYRVVGNFPDAGSWKLGEDKDDIYLTSDTPGSKEEAFRITRLKNKELWVKQTESNGDVLYLKYKQ